MPILTIQAQFRELGRIRTGQQVEGKNGRKRPTRLDTFRLTSQSKDALDHAQAIYGGTVEPWENEWQLVTDASSLDIVLPQGPATLTQWNELWTGGGCQRRCDGVREHLSDSPCLCPADPADRMEAAKDGEACKPTTRLSVILPSLPDIGVWVLVTHSYYAASELQGTASLLLAAAGAGRMIPARLRIDQRTVKRPNQPRKDFIVPVIEIGQTMHELVGGQVPEIEGRPQPLALPEPAALPDVVTMPVGISKEDFVAKCREARLPYDKVMEVRSHRYGDRDLTDSDRAELWAIVALLEPESIEAPTEGMFDDVLAELDAEVPA